MLPDKPENPTSVEILCQITQNLTSDKSITKNLVEEIRQTETDIHVKLQKTQKDLQKIHYLNEQGNSE